MDRAKNTFCALPWKHLATHPHGMVSLCCRAICKDNVGMARTQRASGWVHYHKLNTDTIDETINSDSFRETRLQMLAGKEPAGCADCYASEHKGLASKRHQENKDYDFTYQEAQRLTLSDGRIKPSFKFIELRLGNLCNLKCRTCNPASSSKWKTDYQQLEQKLNFLRPYKHIDDFSWVDSESFWQELELQSPELQLIYINGGEPTLIQPHWKFLKRLADSGKASQISLMYNSNMTFFKPEFFEIWKQFKNVKVGASIDDIGERNHYIRYPSRWDEVEANVEKFRGQGVDMYITQTVSAYNLFYLNDLAAWAGPRNLSIGYNFVMDPSFLSPQALPLEIRKHAIAKLKPTLPAYLYSQLENHIDQTQEATELHQFLQFNYELDILRKEKFEEVFPELYEQIKSVTNSKKLEMFYSNPVDENL